MPLPPLLATGLLGFWGWQTGLLPVAALLAALLEAPRFVAVRFEIGTARLARTFDLCLMLGFAIAGALALGRPVSEAVVATLRWAPAWLAPFVAAQTWSAAGAVDLKALWSNRQRRPDPPARPYLVDFRWPYLGVGVIAAAAANQRTDAFYAGLVALAAWALLGTRRRDASPAVWLALVCAAAAVGYAGHHGLTRLQTALVQIAVQIIAGGGDDTDPFSRETAIGQIGDIKLSDGIVARLWPAPGHGPPALLHRATYDGYAGARWTAAKARLVPLDPPAPGAPWRVAPAHGARPEAVRIATAHDGGRAVLAAPWGTRTVDGPAIELLRRNRLGVLEFTSATSGLLAYRVAFDPQARDTQAPPGERDRQVPDSERALLARLVDDIGLDAGDPVAAIGVLGLWFEAGFGYSLYQPDRPPGRSALARFLTETRAGHCEYFATATVLLLRAAGIPARYATGYSIQEWSDLEGAYLVRRRHAHAWARAWTGSRWVDVDTTPSAWVEAERGEAPAWQPALDLWDWAVYRFRAWRAGAAGAGVSPWWWAVLAALAASAGWRLRGRLATRRRAPAPATAAAHRVAATDPAFSRLERHLESRGLGRGTVELPSRWARRIGPRLPGDRLAGDLRALVALHYRCRYDPAGDRGADRRRLAEHVDAWLAGLASADPAQPR